MMLTLFTVSLIYMLCTSISDGKRPNIVFIVADDLGWNDVGFHNPSMITPNIDKLAYQGVILNHSYVQPVCSPSRHAFMTGYYPFKAGLQHMVICDEQDVCSPLNMTFLSSHLKKAGYATHAIGKWHLGFCSWECTPEYRGFESFYGYYNSRSDYFTHEEANYLDFHDGYDVVWDKNGSYSADLYAERAEHIIAKHNNSQPLFLYLPYQNVHEPLQVPPQYEALYPDVKTKDRRTYCGMVTALDAAIGRVVEALKKKGLYDDTIFFLTPDNGGMITKGGNNWPLRGSKITVWEGGTRTIGFVSGSRLQKTGYTFDGLMHAVDWHPTILTAAGLTYGNIKLVIDLNLK
ncbi:arylsulfatase B-like [Ruditapes philippinarum]|uniref:arylsulfatase B-like n=1 Tax=Ruditapes philippinarum TaxID=129788 RepID=UPI00295B3286|nr:arylsulfatase B-like [Ruditapes philippinarum]